MQTKYLCDVTSCDVDVTSLHIGVVSPTSDEIGNVDSTSLGLATVPARKFHKNFSEISVEKMRDFIFTFFAQKNCFLGLKPWPDAFLPGIRSTQNSY
jgi:hypothetical protein